MEYNAGLHAVIRGFVQGVSFRRFVLVNARRLGLTGYVLNLPSGNEVEVLAKGDRSALQELLSMLKDGSTGSIVEHVEVTWTDYSTDYATFTVRR
ncbi:MAG: acylphosphatase [Dehalococcoidia bacterium]|nr:acylphosphatase [Dehalococcoidia bacterium]